MHPWRVSNMHTPLLLGLEQEAHGLLAGLRLLGEDVERLLGVERRLVLRLLGAERLLGEERLLRLLSRLH